MRRVSATRIARWRRWCSPGDRGTACLRQPASPMPSSRKRPKRRPRFHLRLSLAAIIYDVGGRRFSRVTPDDGLGGAALRPARAGWFPLGARGAGRFAMQGVYFVNDTMAAAFYRSLAPFRPGWGISTGRSNQGRRVHRRQRPRRGGRARRQSRPVRSQRIRAPLPSIATMLSDRLRSRGGWARDRRLLIRDGAKWKHNADAGRHQPEAAVVGAQPARGSRCTALCRARSSRSPRSTTATCCTR